MKLKDEGLSIKLIRDYEPSGIPILDLIDNEMVALNALGDSRDEEYLKTVKEFRLRQTPKPAS